MLAVREITTIQDLELHEMESIPRLVIQSDPDTFVEEQQQNWTDRQEARWDSLFNRVAVDRTLRAQSHKQDKGDYPQTRKGFKYIPVLNSTGFWAWRRLWIFYGMRFFWLNARVAPSLKESRYDDRLVVRDNRAWYEYEKGACGNREIE